MSRILSGLLLALALLFGVTPSAGAEPIHVNARGHVQNIGWQDWTDAGVVGTTGQSLRLEAIQVQGRFAPVWCQAHVQDLGWLPPVRDGEVCGTTGRALRLEAVRLWTE